MPPIVTTVFSVTVIQRMAGARVGVGGCDEREAECRRTGEAVETFEHGDA
jgi:hypothetical protein